MGMKTEDERHRMEEDKESAGMSERIWDNNPTQVTATVACYHTSAWSEIHVMHTSINGHIYAPIHTHKPHTRTILGMLTATAPRAPSVLRGNSRNEAVRNLQQSFTFLRMKEFKLFLLCVSRTSESHSSTPAACVLHTEDATKTKYNMLVFYMHEHTDPTSIVKK